MNIYVFPPIICLDYYSCVHIDEKHNLKLTEQQATSSKVRAPCVAVLVPGKIVDPEEVKAAILRTATDIPPWAVVW